MERKISLLLTGFLALLMAVPVMAHSDHKMHDNVTSEVDQDEGSRDPISEMADGYSFTENMVIAEVALVSVLLFLASRHYFRS